MKHRLFWLTVVGLALALVLSACGGGPSGGPETANEENAPAEEVAPTEEAVPTEETAPAEEVAPTEEAMPVEEVMPEVSEPAEEEMVVEPELQLSDQLNVYNWDDYIDDALITAYEDEFGVEIIYDTFASNEDLLAKLQAGATGYDVIFPSDYMVKEMIDLGLLAEINTSDLSNWGNIGDDFKDAPFDPGNKHCVPYQWGTTGIGYRAGYAYFDENPPDSWSYLFDPAVLAEYADDGINVLNDQRELIGAALIYLGYSVNDTEQAHIDEARDLILQAKPYWKTFNSEDYDDTLLIPDEVVLSQGWSGDVAVAYYETYDDAAEDGNWYYDIPNEGAVKWLDNICITASTEHYETALHFINYLLDAENGAAITNYTYYASPNEAAKEFILEEILDDESIYPPSDVLAKLQWIEDVGDAVFMYDEAWTAIKG